MAPGLTASTPLHQRLVGHVEQVACPRGQCTGAVHPAGVAVPAFEDDGDVDVDDVAFGKLFFARDAVADDVVDAGADRLGEAAVVQRRRHCAVRQDELVAQPVQLGGGHTGDHMRCDHVQCARRELAGSAHPGEILLAVDGDAPCLAAAVHSCAFYRCKAAKMRLRGWGGKASASFLKKRSKKLLLPVGCQPWSARQRRQKFFGSFFQKRTACYAFLVCAAPAHP